MMAVIGGNECELIAWIHDDEQIMAYDLRRRESVEERREKMNFF
jgi:hypothetical protein